MPFQTWQLRTSIGPGTRLKYHAYTPGVRGTGDGRTPTISSRFQSLTGLSSSSNGIEEIMTALSHDDVYLKRDRRRARSVPKRRSLGAGPPRQAHADLAKGVVGSRPWQPLGAGPSGWW